MLLIREIARVLRDLGAFAIGTRRIGVVLLVVAVVAITTTTAAVVHLGPVAIYPFL